MRYTIESRPLTSQQSLQAAYDGHARQTTIEAATPDDAVSEFLRQSASELVSMSRPRKGRESIATVKKDDSVFLLRVYTL